MCPPPRPPRPPARLLQLCAGGLSSFCSGVGSNMHFWGKLKTNGDNQT